MKKVISIGTILFALILMTSCEKETVISEQDLPTELKTYISTHFSGTSIQRAVKEKDDAELYEVTLANGVKLEFNKNNEIIDIDWNAKLPDSVIPPNLLAYANTHYPTNYVIGWEIQGSNQEIQLNNNIALVFTMSGDFVRIDD